MAPTDAARLASSALFDGGTCSPSIWRAMNSTMALMFGFSMVFMMVFG
jgi:hypothetical protein